MSEREITCLKKPKLMYLFIVNFRLLIVRINKFLLRVNRQKPLTLCNNTQHFINSTLPTPLG